MRPHLPQGLEQRHLDLIGLFLIAAGVYLAFVLFFGWEGGKVGYGIETGLDYLFGTVGARIATVLILVIGGVLVTGTSISSIFRGAGRGLRRVFLGGRGVAETAILHREDRRQEKTMSDFETRAGATDVMSTYPDEDEFEPTVALVDGRRGTSRRRGSPDMPGREAEDMSDQRASSASDDDRNLTPSAADADPDDPAQGGRARVVPPPSPALTPRATSAASPPPRRSTTGRRRPTRSRGARGRQGPRSTRPGRGRPQAGRDARPLRRRGEDRRHRQRPARLPLRAAPRARAPRSRK